MAVNIRLVRFWMQQTWGSSHHLPSFAFFFTNTFHGQTELGRFLGNVPSGWVIITRESKFVFIATSKVGCFRILSEKHDPILPGVESNSFIVFYLNGAKYKIQLIRLWRAKKNGAPCPSRHHVNKQQIAANTHPSMLMIAFPAKTVAEIVIYCKTKQLDCNIMYLLHFTLFTQNGNGPVISVVCLFAQRRFSVCYTQSRFVKLGHLAVKWFCIQPLQDRRKISKLWAPCFRKIVRKSRSRTEITTCCLKALSALSICCIWMISLLSLCHAVTHWLTWTSLWGKRNSRFRVSVTTLCLFQICHQSERSFCLPSHSREGRGDGAMLRAQPGRQGSAI